MENITIELNDEEFLFIAKMAHDYDITFNQMVAKILQEQIDNGEVHNSTRES
jgi:predicted DNA-binding ribbon-helix-helix protein